MTDFHKHRLKCEGCPFRGPRCGSKGAEDAPFVIIGESPGAIEVAKKIPFAGPSGKLINSIVPIGANILYLNALECSPPNTSGKKAKLLAQATATCSLHLLEKVKAYPRKLIISFGNAATWALTGNYGLKITQIRGRLIKSPLASIGILPIVHPAALMRGTGNYRQWKEDVVYGWDLASGGQPKVHKAGKVQVVPIFNSQEKMEREVDSIMELITQISPELTCDIETTGLNIKELVNVPQKTKAKSRAKDASTKDEGKAKERIYLKKPEAQILTIGITPASDTSISYCFRPAHLPALKKWMEDPRLKWCWHNGKFDIRFFRKHALAIQAKVDDDTMLMSYTLDESGGIHDLETVSTDVLGAPDYKFMVKPYLPNKDSSYALIPFDVLSQYQAFDTCNTAQVREIYRKRIAADPVLEKLYTKTLIPASAMLAQLELNGIQVDPHRLNENESLFTGEMNRLANEIQNTVGYQINPGSSMQVKDLVYGKLKVKDLYKGSTDAASLTDMYIKTENPLFQQLIEYRKVQKFLGTYVIGLRRWLTPEDRIHGTYLLHGTKTGRLAARQPNMQNPPRLASIRGSFIAREGCILIEVDLSQAELRTLACISGDPILCQVYLDGLDLHSDLARFLFPGWDDFDPVKKKESRVKCKNVNFGIIYGITAYGLFDQIGGSLVECKRLIDGWYARYQVAGSFIKKCRDAAAHNQVITTPFGRRKRIGVVSRQNLRFMENEAANFPPQSIASDITLHSAIKLYQLLWHNYQVKIVNLVHDAIIMEVPPIHTKEVIDITVETMSMVPREWGIKKVPFVADAAVGERWGSLKELSA